MTVLLSDERITGIAAIENGEPLVQQEIGRTLCTHLMRSGWV
jgi:hypothetical protein